MNNIALSKYNYIILGAGPAGLAFAAELFRHGERSFIILEKEAEAGGLCRSTVVDGAPLDIGGCHLLDARNKEACEFLFSYMASDYWKKHKRYNTIRMNTGEIGYPFENYIWQFPENTQKRYIKSLLDDNKKSSQEPDNFKDWIVWHFGKEIAHDYMLPYNQKIWSVDLSKMGTYWLNKLPPITYEDIRRSIAEKKSPDIFAAHNVFYYPVSNAFGDVFKNIAKSMESHIIYNYNVKSVDADTCSVDGRFQGRYIINTVPWTSIKYENVPDTVLDNIGKLLHTSIDIDYYSDRIDTKSQAIYCPDLREPYHRIILRYNYNDNWNGYWTETNDCRSVQSVRGSFHYKNEYAYPINTLEKPEAIKSVLKWFEEKSVVGLGRWGEWEHYNSDAVIVKGKTLAEKMLKT